MQFQDLIDDPPKVHTTPSGDQYLMSMGPDALRFIYDNIAADAKTLETGCGVSTAVFALKAAEHTCITPAGDEVLNLKSYCRQRNIPLDKVSFQVGGSANALVGLDRNHLDLVLIDGCHGFPTVFLDWYYTSARVKVDGIMIIDNTDIWTGDVLKNVLTGEPEWKLEHWFTAQTAVFRKLREYDPAKNWVDQPYVVRSSAPLRRRSRRQWWIQCAKKSAGQGRPWRLAKDLAHVLLSR